MTVFITQYKVLFYLSWILLYIIFPAWALPVSVNARAFVFFGLIIYFCISACLMNRWFNALTVDKPVIVQVTNLGKHIKANLWLVIVCCIAVILHIYPIFFPILILGDETIHLQSGLWIYEYIDTDWHSLFQIAFWVLVGLILLIRKTKVIDNLLCNRLSNSFPGLTKTNLFKYSVIFLSMVFLIVYFLLLRNMTYLPSLIRYPPVSKFLYFLTYSAFGIDHIFPRIMQLIFYLLCAVYLYRTINLFYEKETALLGASIYLFLPVVFAYARLGELASGTIFFIVVISFYFIRFIKNADNRDLLIVAYLIGIGFLYKKPILLMFIICFIFLIAHKIKKHNLHSLIHLKILSLSLVPIIPWMILSKYFSWRNYSLQLSNFTSLDSKIVTYFSLLSSNLSVIIFILFVLSIFYVCLFKRNTLTLFFGFLFIVYYFFVVSDMGWLSPRFSMLFYPTIIIFLSLFISRIIQNIKWRHAFKLCFVVLTTYLIIISSVSPLNSRFLTIMNKKLHYFPSEEAMKWVKENIKEGEKILTMRIMSANFYRVKYGIDRNRIIAFWYEIKDVSTPEKLRAYYQKNEISYIMFPYSPKYPYPSDILPYLKDNKDKDYIEVVKFNLDDNFIYIYKLKEI